MTLDYAAVRRAYPLADVLRARCGREIRGGKFPCLIPGHDDRHPSAVILPGGERWYCHACGTSGDVIDAIRYVEGEESARALMGADVRHSNGPSDEAPPSPSFPRSGFKPFPEVEAAKFQDNLRTPPILKDTGQHKTYRPVHAHHYRDESGRTLCVVLRLEHRDGSKTLLPVRWHPDHGAVNAGYRKGEKSPLYNRATVQRLARAPVLVVEGEKKADAAQTVLGESWAVVSWMSGAKAVDNCDWSPVAGRDLTVWPDADEVGLGVLGKIPGAMWWIEPEPGWRQGYDVYDALWEGRDIPAILDARKPIRERPRTPADFWAGISGRSIVRIRDEPDPRHEVNVRIALMEHPDFADRLQFDLFERVVLFDGRPLEDDDYLGLLEKVHAATGLKPNGEKFRVVVDGLAIRKSINRIADWLHGLRWDHKPRDLLDYTGCEKTAYTDLIGFHWLCGMVRRILHPGCKMDGMLVLVGRQDLGKSLFFETLGRFGDRNLHVEIDRLSERDDRMLLRGKAIVELSEMTAHRRSEDDLLKSLLTRTTDTYRLPWGRAAVDVPRSCVFAGTINGRHFLRDLTGNRRYWPVETGQLDIAGLERDREQLLAEAVFAVENTPRQWWFTADERALVNAETRQYLIDPPWKESLEAYLEKRDQAFTDDLWVQGMQVGSMERRTPQLNAEMHKAMAALGWHYTNLRLENDSRRRGWRRVR